MPQQLFPKPIRRGYQQRTNRTCQFDYAPAFRSHGRVPAGTSCGATLGW
jgi:hypothetical protein